jgi:phosphoribosylaminoimidazole-succinocarboxamide synthase
LPLAAPLLETRFHGLAPHRQGKVRDIYDLGDALLFVATDRISAFDYVLGSGIPDKGKVLTQLSAFWFGHTQHIVANHLISMDVPEFPGRAMRVQKTTPVPIECVARGYLSGSGWKDYQAGGAVCGVTLPAGLRESERLPEPIFTPARKAERGEHDENVDFATVAAMVGEPLARRIREVSLELYRRVSDYAAGRGILIADTKFEFGLDAGGTLHLMDEVLTADSSRFWPADAWRPGESPPSFDKQFVRDYLETVPGWNKTPPAPPLPAAVIERTAAKYRDALLRLTGQSLD